MQIINFTKTRPIWLNPVGVFEEIPSFANFVPFVRELGRSISRDLLLYGITAGLTAIVLMSTNRREASIYDIKMGIYRKLDSQLSEGEVVVLIIIALIKAIEIQKVSI